MRVSPIPALLSLVLVFACAPALAMESRHMSADGGEGCPVASSVNDRAESAEADPNLPATPAKRPGKAKAVASPRAGGGTRSNAPRWHSFLPGMFR